MSLKIALKCDTDGCDNERCYEIDSFQIENLLKANITERITVLINHTFCDEEYSNSNWKKINNYIICNHCANKIEQYNNFTIFNDREELCEICENEKRNYDYILCNHCKYKSLYFKLYGKFPIENLAWQEPYASMEKCIRENLSKFDNSNYEFSVKSLYDKKYIIKTQMLLLNKLKSHKKFEINVKLTNSERHPKDQNIYFFDMFIFCVGDTIYQSFYQVSTEININDYENIFQEYIDDFLKKIQRFL